VSNRFQSRYAMLLRHAERAGYAQPPPELRDQIRCSGWSDAVIDAGLAALAGIEVELLGPHWIVTSPLDSRRVAQLCDQYLIQPAPQGWSLTAKGEIFLDLIRTYSDPRHQWRPRF
jgi:hypothetical protein